MNELSSCGQSYHENRKNRLLVIRHSIAVVLVSKWSSMLFQTKVLETCENNVE